MCSTRNPSLPGWIPIDLALGGILVRQLTELLRKENISRVYCVGGATNVDVCETTPDQAFLINAYGPQAAAQAAHDCGAAFVYFSTDYIFDGCDGPYTESDEPAPLSVYGRSKLAGEEAVRKAHPDALIVRTTGVYGPDQHEKNFLYGLRRNLLSGQTFRVASDQYSTPTYNADLAAATVALLDLGVSGIFNVAGPNVLSRHQFALIAAATIGHSTELIHGTETSELMQKAARPLLAGLTSDKLRSALPNLYMRTPIEGIKTWIKHNT